MTPSFIRLLPFLAIATAFAPVPSCTVFCPTPRILSPIKTPSTLHSTPPNNETPNLVDSTAFQTAIDTLKQDMGIEIIPPEQRPPYAIGKLRATLPLGMVSGIRLADCETLTLISQIQTRVVEETGIQSLDTIVSIRAGKNNGDDEHSLFEGDTKGASIGDTAKIYTEAINYAMERGLDGIELEVNRLVPLMPSGEVETVE